MTDVRVALPVHLQTLARVQGEVRMTLDGLVSITTLLDALEAHYPMLRGTIRDQGTGRRRAFIRYFAAGSDLSFAEVDGPLPEGVATGREVFSVVGAIAGG